MVYSLRLNKGPDLMGMLSLVTTWALLGMKCAKTSELFGLWKYRKKQKKKIKTLEARIRVVDADASGICFENSSIEDETTFSDRKHLESVEMSSRGLHQDLA